MILTGADGEPIDVKTGEKRKNSFLTKEEEGGVLAHLVATESIYVVLESVSLPFEKMCWYFPSLQRITLVGCGLTTIKGQTSCEHLIYLNLKENKLTSLDGLQNFRNLKELFVCNNEITSFENHLAKLTGLQALWAGENKIRSLDGVDHLRSLRNLNMGGNKI